jgi:hypothetical protein
MRHGRHCWIRVLPVTLILAIAIASASAPINASANAPTEQITWRITWEVLDSDYLERSIVVKDILGLEGIHYLKLPFGASMPFKGQLCEGFKAGNVYAIKINGRWYFW